MRAVSPANEEGSSRLGHGKTVSVRLAGGQTGRGMRMRCLCPPDLFWLLADQRLVIACKSCL